MTRKEIIEKLQAKADESISALNGDTPEDERLDMPPRFTTIYDFFVWANEACWDYESAVRSLLDALGDPEPPRGEGVLDSRGWST